MPYRSVTFKSVVDGVFALAGVTRTTAADPVALLAQVVEFVNTRIREGVEYDFWPELCPVEERTYRDAWDDAEDYAADAEVWYPGLGGLVISGAGTSAANGTYLPVVGSTSYNRPKFWKDGNVSSGYYIVWSGLIDDNWRLYGPAGSLYATLGGEVYPWEATEWTVGSGTAPAPTGWEYTAATLVGAGYYRRTAATGFVEGEPFDSDLWLALTSFARYIALDQTDRTPIGEAVTLHRQDPRINPRAPRLPFTLSADGIVPPPGAPDVVYLRFRIRPPAYSAANYADATPANFPIPYVIESFVRRAACADFLRMDAKFEEAGRMEARAREDLLNASDAAGASQGQFTTARACTY